MDLLIDKKERPIDFSMSFEVILNRRMEANDWRLTIILN
jgi:hypothetical protein